MYRYEQSGTSYDIRVKGQEIDDSDKELLEGIVLKLEDEGIKTHHGHGRESLLNLYWQSRW